LYDLHHLSYLYDPLIFEEIIHQKSNQMKYFYE
jgi:hypothetical protein